MAAESRLNVAGSSNVWRVRRPLALLGVIAALVGEAIAQTQPDAAEILKKVGETYPAVKEFGLVSISTGTAVPGRVVWAFRAPSQFRLEGADPDLDRADGSFDKTVLVRDGSSGWWYHPRTNEYAAFTSEQLPDKGTRKASSSSRSGASGIPVVRPGVF